MQAIFLAPLIPTSPVLFHPTFLSPGQFNYTDPVLFLENAALLLGQSLGMWVPSTCSCCPLALSMPGTLSDIPVPVTSFPVTRESTYSHLTEYCFYTC